ncbi:MAG: insulinase family protein, partial [Sphingomonadales bacterium]|nr:insulinase family protein [Sphingomonadales bacterium]
VTELPATRTAIKQTVGAVRDVPVSDDILKRAREPMLEGFDNLLKTNSGWLSFVDRAQTEPEDIERFQKSRALVEAITPADIQSAARKYLTPDGAVEVNVLPEGVDDPLAPPQLKP